MLKNKFKIIALLAVVLFTLMTPIVRAENETNDANGVMPISENPEGGNTENVTNTDQTANVTDDNFKKHDVYLTGDKVTVDYIVDGNLFIFANEVTINSQVGGDAFIAAKSITVGEQGYIFSNLFALSQSVAIKGVVYDLYATANDVTITGYVYRDIRTASKDLKIGGTIGRNAYVSCSNLFFEQQTDQPASTAQGKIAGNLEYCASKEASIPEGSVTGETKFTQDTITNSNRIQKYLLSLGTIVATAALIWLLCLWLAPKFLKNTTPLVSKKILPVIGLGLISPIVLVLISILLLVLGITSSFGLLLLASLFILIGFSTSIFIITINNLVCDKLKIEKNIRKFGMLVATAIVLWLIGLIPYVGSIVGFIAVIIGMGIVISHLVLRDRKVKETAEVKE